METEKIEIKNDIEGYVLKIAELQKQNAELQKQVFDMRKDLANMQSYHAREIKMLNGEIEAKGKALESLRGQAVNGKINDPEYDELREFAKAIASHAHLHKYSYSGDTEIDFSPISEYEEGWGVVLKTLFWEKK